MFKWSCDGFRGGMLLQDPSFKKKKKDKKTVRAVSPDVLASCAERCTQELSAVLKAFLFFTVVGARNTDPPLLVIVR